MGEHCAIQSKYESRKRERTKARKGQRLLYSFVFSFFRAFVIDFELPTRYPAGSKTRLRACGNCGLLQTQSWVAQVQPVHDLVVIVLRCRVGVAGEGVGVSGL